MTEPRSWSDTPAGLLANGGWVPDDRSAEFAAREAEHRQARIAFEAAVAADPSWAKVRDVQQALAERGWPGTVISVGRSVPPELEPLYTAQTASQARVGTFFEGRATNDVAVEFERLAADRLAAAQLRQQVENLRLPPGSPR